MARNFIDQEESNGMSVGDGFKFGFGFFVANLLGLTLVGALAFAVSYFTGYQLR